jgi:hypothetical protein
LILKKLRGDMKSDIVRPDPIMRQIEYSSPLAFAEGLFYLEKRENI